MRRLPFIITSKDVQKICSSAFSAFIETFKYREVDTSALSYSDNEVCSSESDLSNYDPATFGCGEITPEVENMVETNWEICNPLANIYGPETSSIIKETISTVSEESEETQCASLQFFKDIIPNNDQNLIKTCTAVCYWCCCNSLKKASPIVAEATTNLLI